MKRTLIVAAVGVALLAASGLAWAAAGFSDVRHDHHRVEDIRFVSQQGWFRGYPDGTFKPEKDITAGQMALVLERAFDGMTRAQFASFIRAGQAALAANPDPPPRPPESVARADCLEQARPRGVTGVTIDYSVNPWVRLEGPNSHRLEYHHDHIFTQRADGSGWCAVAVREARSGSSDASPYFGLACWSSQYKNWRPHPEYGQDVWVQPNGTGPITLDSIDVDFPAVANECVAVDADPSLYVNLLCTGELSHLEAVRDSDTCTPP